jgi:hypothetical protein
LIDATKLNQANLSKHLQLLHAHGFVARRRDGPFVVYELGTGTCSRCATSCAHNWSEGERNCGERRVDGAINRWSDLGDATPRVNLI